MKYIVSALIRISKQEIVKVAQRKLPLFLLVMKTYIFSVISFKVKQKNPCYEYVILCHVTDINGSESVERPLFYKYF